MRVTLLASLFALAAAGCSSSTECDRVHCGPCPESLAVRITGASASTIATLDGGTCALAAGVVTCSAALSAGEHDVSVTIDGVPRTLNVTIAPAPAGCCACLPTTTQTIDLVARDSGVDASAPGDVGVDAAATRDSGIACDPSVVRFPAGGSLVVGQLCDDVFACVASAADAAALQAAAPNFTCDAAPSGGCTGITCRYAPSTLDATELAEVCRVTLLSPQPSLVCMIYL